MSIWRNSILVPALLLAACGPRLVGVEDDGSTSAVETTGEPSTSTATATSEDPWMPDDTSSTNDSESFVDGGDYSFADACDMLAQDCPVGEKCVPFATREGGGWDDNKCVPILGEQAVGEPCRYGGRVEATDDCDDTSVCWDVMEIDGELLGTCRPFCTGTPDNPSCEDGYACSTGSDSTIVLCIPLCNPLEQDCGPGLGCYWSGFDFSCILTTQDLPVGAPCGYINDCEPGNICLDAVAVPNCMGAACCTNYCDVQLGPEQCDALPGTACAWFWQDNGEAPPGYDDVGVCVLPEP